jgi:cholesterol oxidase
MKVRFTETMAGFYTPGAPAYDTGEVVGRRDWNRLSFTLTMATDNLRAMLEDPDHRMSATGEVLCKEFAPVPLPVINGSFDLFTDASERRYRMRYRLPLRTDRGPMTVLGFKDVGDDWGFDAWPDTTTLFTRIVSGTADHDADVSTEYARGTLRLTVPMFARQLTTFRGSPAGIGGFGAFFVSRLAIAYGGHRRKRPL